LAELSLTSAPSLLHETFSNFRESARTSAKNHVKISLPRILHVTRHVLSTLTHSLHPEPETNASFILSSPPIDSTATPKKRRRVSTGFIAVNIADDDEELDSDINQTPVPHPSNTISNLENSYDTAPGVNEKVKELMRVTKRQVTQLLTSMTHIKTWVQLDHPDIPRFPIADEISTVEKWGADVLDGFPAYHAKRAQYVKENKESESGDWLEAIAELDSVQLWHLQGVLWEVVQICGIFYGELESFVTKI
ncbi:hypothetical protein HDU99_005438, partial [Rhizoclosmatium hyalinum]